MFNYKDVYINNWFSIIGPLEQKTKLKNYDIGLNDYYYGEETLEKAEVKMQKKVIDNLTLTANIDLILGSDLLNQLSTTNMSLVNRGIPYIGLYSACASSIGSLNLLASLISAKQIKHGMFITSSHNLTAEKQFRFPIEYGFPKPKRSTYTATGAIGITLSKEPSNLKVINGTIGSVIDSDIKDVHNMGAVMAKGAADTLLKHLEFTKTKVNDYDLILTGDLGKVGMKLFKELLNTNNIKIKNYLDAGAFLFDNEENSGASGPAVLPLVFFDNIVYNKKYKKILLIGTGSLHSPSIVNQKNTLPTISHALTIEVVK